MIARGSGEARPISVGEPDKVTAWPFKEPEKKSAWKDEPAAPRDVKIDLRDSEGEGAAKRTALIKAQMSPPGALGLPPLLEAARFKWGIPDGAFKCRAVFDRIHVFPIDPFDNDGKLPGSTLWKAELTKKKDEQNGHRGILISMGLSALDQCSSHGIEVGHVVQTIRNAPHAMECARLEGTPMYYLVMRAGDLTGSETQEEQLRSGETRIVDEGGSHSYCFQVDGKKKISAHIRDQW